MVGIDVSNHQGNINWSAVKASGVEFAFIKSTEGISFRDPFFKRNWQGAKANGIYRGAYHFALPFENDARAEADFFYNVVMDAGVEEGDILVLDMEVMDPTNYADYSDWTLYWMEITQSYFEYPPIIYTAKNYITELHLDTEPKLGQYGLWLAQWLVNPQAATKNNVPEAPDPWEITAFWQYTDKGRINGINGPVDLNLFNGATERIPLYGKPKEDEKKPPQLDVEALLEQLAFLDKEREIEHHIATMLKESLDRADASLQEIRKILEATSTSTGTDTPT